MTKKKGKILLDKWMYLLVALDRYKGYSLNKITQKLGITYSWASALFKEIEKRGWVLSKKSGRELEYILTHEGNSVLDLCRTLLYHVDGPDHFLLKEKVTENLILKEKERKIKLGEKE
jgi:DNA-binding MarR family transcriptional regulator